MVFSPSNVPAFKRISIYPLSPNVRGGKGARGEFLWEAQYLIAWEKKMALFGDLGDRRELEKKAKAEGRLPPGQSLTLKWPVLHYGSIPPFDPAKWDFKWNSRCG